MEGGGVGEVGVEVEVGILGVIGRLCRLFQVGRFVVHLLLLG